MRKHLSLGMALMFVLIPAAQGQSYPDRPIRLIWPYSGGTGGDAAWRAAAEAAGRVLGQPIVLENRPGSAGRNGINALKTAAKDGYLLAGGTTGEVVIQGVAEPELRLEPLVDYAPVSLLLESNLVLGAHPSVPFRDIKALIQYAKSNPGKLNAGHGGFGTATHIAISMLAAASNIDIVMVPFKGAGPSTTAVLANVVQLTFNSAGVKALIESGKMVGLATAGEKRWKLFPTIPTMVESGIPATSVLWHGLLAPAGTPETVVVKLQAAFAAGMKAPEVAEKLEKGLGLDVVGSTQEAFAARIKSDTAALAPVIRKLNLKFN